MTRADVTTRAKHGQWLNQVEGEPERSQSFSSRDEALQAGRVLADELGSTHRVLDSDATGVITDGGSPEDEVPIVGEKAPEQTGMPDTTDEDGMPLENPSG